MGKMGYIPQWVNADALGVVAKDRMLGFDEDRVLAVLAKRSLSEKNWLAEAEHVWSRPDLGITPLDGGHTMLTNKKLVQPNLDYFEAQYTHLRQHHAGKWVLLHDGSLVSSFDRIRDAQRAAREKGLTKHLILFVDR